MKKLAILALTLCACSSTPALVNGAPAFYQVHHGFYRSAQPTTDAQWEAIRVAMDRDVGVQTHVVVKLNFESEGSDALAWRHGFRVVYLPVQPGPWWGVFEGPNWVMLRDISDTIRENLPHGVLTHCEYGHDRTGGVVAWERYLDGWSRQQAESEWAAYGGHVWGGPFPPLLGLEAAWRRGWAQP